jgi:alpha-galactosidase
VSSGVSWTTDLNPSTHAPQDCRSHRQAFNWAALFLAMISTLRQAALFVIFAFVGTAHAADPAFWNWAPTPPMGWNSWDCFATTVTETQSRATADVMAAKLLAHGYNTLTVDIQWYEPGAKSSAYRGNAYLLPNEQRRYREVATLAMDEFGRLLPAENRFPSAAGGLGFKPLADYVHAKGLKFGIHLMRGIPRQAVAENTPIKGTAFHAADIADKVNICSWNPDMWGVDMSKPGAQEYYDSVFALIASWGVDYVKVDDLSRPYLRNRPEVEAIRQAIDKTSRPIVLSLSPGATDLKGADHVVRHANLWRISDDFWDRWPALVSQFTRLRNWSEAAPPSPGRWPDADMLPLGTLEQGRRQTRFTPDEQVTMLTLWSIARSPLILGADLMKLDDATLALVTNDEVLAVNQRGAHPRQFFRHDDGRVAWVSDAPDGGKYLALFNIANAPTDETAPPSTGLEVPVKLAELGLPAGEFLVRDLWQHKDLGRMKEEFSPLLAWHGAGLYHMTMVK